MGTKTLSIRIGDDDYKFLSIRARKERGDMSSAVRELVDLGKLAMGLKHNFPPYADINLLNFLSATTSLNAMHPVSLMLLAPRDIENQSAKT